MMKKLSVAISIAALALVAQAQNNTAPINSGLIATSEVSRFVGNSHNCDIMLGVGHDGDVLPAAYSVALNASLNEINAPADQAIAKIYASCTQHQHDLKSAKL
jgi:hypothetical protein